MTGSRQESAGGPWARTPIAVPDEKSSVARKPDQQPFFSVVIPVRNDPDNLRACLASLARSSEDSFEVIVVDDGSSDQETRRVARDASVLLIELPSRRGPAFARNVGVEAAQAEIIVFVDADVEVEAATLSSIRRRFETHPTISALFGSYDRSPAGQNLLSQYRNLLHHYTHQMSCERAFTFWTGCGAIKRSDLLAAGGFEHRFGRPSVEDIELGHRLNSAGKTVLLCREVQVKHRKIWRLASMVRCDLLQRGIPWTRELLAFGTLPADLNLRFGDRLLAALAGLLTVLLVAIIALDPMWLLAPPFIVASVGLADRLSSAPSGRQLTRWWPLRIVAVVEALGLLWLAIATIRNWPLILAGLVVLLIFLRVRGDFYAVLRRARGHAFLFLAFQAHVLYYWICALAFSVGWILHLVRPLPRPDLAARKTGDSRHQADLERPLPGADSDRESRVV